MAPPILPSRCLSARFRLLELCRVRGAWSSVLAGASSIAAAIRGGKRRASVSALLLGFLLRAPEFRLDLSVSLRTHRFRPSARREIAFPIQVRKALPHGEDCALSPNTRAERAGYHGLSEVAGPGQEAGDGCNCLSTPDRGGRADGSSLLGRRTEADEPSHRGVVADCDTLSFRNARPPRGSSDSFAASSGAAPLTDPA